MAHTNNYPKLHNAAWPGVVGKGSAGAEPFIELDTMLDLTAKAQVDGVKFDGVDLFLFAPHVDIEQEQVHAVEFDAVQDRKSTRLNSSHVSISYAVFCLKKKKKLKATLSHKMQITNRPNTYWFSFLAPCPASRFAYRSHRRQRIASLLSWRRWRCSLIPQ